MAQTIQTSHVPAEQLEVLEEFARHTAGPELRDLLMAVTRCVSDGTDLVVLDDRSTLTPAEAAKHLGMSRTHLYKLLDRGEILSHHVGRDRRIRVVDLVAFEEKRQHDCRELAERFAKQQDTRTGAIEEIAGLL